MNDQQNNYNQQPYYDPQNQNKPPYDETAKTMGIVSFVLSLVGLVSGSGIIFGIIGLVLAIMAGKRGYTESFQKAGKIISIISIVLSVLFIGILSCVLTSIIFAGEEIFSGFTGLQF